MPNNDVKKGKKEREEEEEEEEEEESAQKVDPGEENFRNGYRRKSQHRRLTLGKKLLGTDAEIRVSTES